VVQSPLSNNEGRDKSDEESGTNDSGDAGSHLNAPLNTEYIVSKIGVKWKDTVCEINTEHNK
jgi:hypothetical protein